MIPTRILVAAVLLLGIPMQASLGQSSDDGKLRPAFGLRAGYGTNPDQFVVGAQSVLGRAFKVMRLAASADAGFGDNMTTLLFNADLRMLSFSPPSSRSVFYTGAGASIALLDASNNGSDTEIGLNIIGGLELPLASRHAYNLEARIGFADMPDFRILFGVLLGGGRK
jgi:hypothetical protein